MEIVTESVNNSRGQDKNNECQDKDIKVLDRTGDSIVYIHVHLHLLKILGDLNIQGDHI